MLYKLYKRVRANTYTYDAEGRPITAAGVATTFDALGRAWEQNRSGAYTQIVYSPGGTKFAFMNGQTLIKYIDPMVAGMAAVHNGPNGNPPNTGYFQHADWLGSSRFAHDSSGNVIYDREYAPFGEPYSETTTTNRDFTGQTEDTTPGLYDFLFRQQSQSQGRWMVPDPAGSAAVDMTNPQTWNRYAYVGNNPVSAVDPVGLCDAVIGGITQSSTDAGTQAQTEFANSIGANLSFPYASGTIPGGFLDVAEQGLIANDSTMAAYATIMNSAAQTPAGQNFNVFTFSGGAQAFNSALSLVPSDVSSRIGNIVYVSPGNVSTLASGNTSTTVVADPFGPTDTVASLGSTGNATLLWTDCSHKANCTFQQFGQFLKSKAGTPCSQAATVSRGNGGGNWGGGYGFGLPGWYGSMMGFVGWVDSIPVGGGSTEVVTHKITLIED